tara:strand:+ start:131 stop:340 length:210 start_codon:yes stop_codon:yes gene_type:complete
MPININMTKEEKIDKIMSLIKDKTSLDEVEFNTIKKVLNSLEEKDLNKLVAGIVFSKKPFKSKKIWRIE